MLACNKLRIDSGKGSPVFEFRIENEGVDSREIPSGTDRTSETEWRRVTPEQISAHVLADTVLAHWLRSRMGLYRLLRACGGDLTRQDDGAKTCEDRLAA